jgi:hypothetical protein
VVDSQDGNWMSGIKFMDELHWVRKQLPEDVLQNKRNAYYFLPFLLGLIGHANE